MRATTILLFGLVAATAAAPATACGPMPGKHAMLAGPTTLGAGTTTVPLRLRGGSDAGPVVVIDGLAFDAAPGVMYELQLQGRGGARAPLGLLNFYTETAPGYGAGGAATGSARRFDAGPALRALGGEATALVFVPTSGVSGAEAARADPAAHVRFAGVRVE